MYFWLFTIVLGAALLVGKAVWQDSKYFKDWKMPPLENAYSIAAFCTIPPLFVLFVLLYLQIIALPFNLTKLEKTDVPSLALAFLGTVSSIGGLFGIYLAILRSGTNERQTLTAEEGLITDRINKATEGLGRINQENEPVIEVRLGALYALERIAKDSLNDHLQIMEILCAYLRTNSRNHNEVDTLIPLRADIQAAITIIARRAKWTKGDERIEIEKTQRYRLDLRSCDLHGVEIPEAHFLGAILNYANLARTNLQGANLSQAELSNANLHYATLDEANMSKSNFLGANLSRATLIYADLRYSSFENAKLTHAYLEQTSARLADFTNADMSHASFPDANMESANFENANLTGAYLDGATIERAGFANTQMTDADMSDIQLYAGDLSACRDLTQKQLGEMFCGIEVIIPKDLKRPDHWPKDDELDFEELYNEWLEDKEFEK